MPEPIPYNSAGDAEINEKIEFEETDISSLLDFAFSLPKRGHVEKSAGKKYLIFRLEETLYGISSEKISEVLNSLKITPLPGVPERILGIANLRGTIVPVIDLRKSMTRNFSEQKQKLLIYHLSKTGEPVALAVDKVVEIAEIKENEINFSAEDFESSFPYCFGKVEYKSRTILLIDAEKLLSSSDMSVSYA